MCNLQYDNNVRTEVLHNDVVDWNMDEFHEESNESHYAEAYSGGHCNFLEFYKEEIGEENMSHQQTSTF